MNIHGQGSIWHVRVCVKGSVQKPATILRARICVPSPHVTVHEVQLVKSEYIHWTEVDNVGVTVVNIDVLGMIEVGVVGVIQAITPIVTCHR